MIFTQIGNQLASLCRDYVSDLFKSGENLWKVIEGEIKNEVTSSPSFKSSKKGSKKKELIFDDDKSLTGRCECL